MVRPVQYYHNNYYARSQLNLRRLVIELGLGFG